MKLQTNSVMEGKTKKLYKVLMKYINPRTSTLGTTGTSSKYVVYYCPLN